MIRYNMNDVTSLADRRMCLRQRASRASRKIFGRSDNMVKLRGVNVFPEAVGAIVGEDRRSNGEYVCVLEDADSGRDHDGDGRARSIKARPPPCALAAKLAESLEGSARRAPRGRAVGRERWRARPSDRALVDVQDRSRAACRPKLAERARTSELGRHPEINSWTRSPSCSTAIPTGELQERLYLSHRSGTGPPGESLEDEGDAFWSEDEMMDYFRRNDVRTILDLSFHQAVCRSNEIREHSRLRVRFSAAATRRHLRPLAAVRSAARARESLREFDRALAMPTPASSGFAVIRPGASACPRAIRCWDPFYQLAIEANAPIMILTGLTGIGQGVAGRQWPRARPRASPPHRRRGGALSGAAHPGGAAGLSVAGRDAGGAHAQAQREL